MKRPLCKRNLPSVYFALSCAAFEAVFRLFSSSSAAYYSLCLPAFKIYDNSCFEYSESVWPRCSLASILLAYVCSLALMRKPPEGLAFQYRKVRSLSIYDLLLRICWRSPRRFAAVLPGSKGFSADYQHALRPPLTVSVNMEMRQNHCCCFRELTDVVRYKIKEEIMRGTDEKEFTLGTTNRTSRELNTVIECCGAAQNTLAQVVVFKSSAHYRMDVTKNTAGHFACSPRDTAQVRLDWSGFGISMQKPHQNIPPSADFFFCSCRGCSLEHHTFGYQDPQRKYPCLPALPKPV